MPETTPLIKAALNLRGGAGFDVYLYLNNVNSKLIVLICYLQGGICALYGYQKSKEDKHKLVIELE